MVHQNHALSALWSRFREAADRNIVGGDWAIALPEQIKRNLRWFWVDGLFASASDNIILTYLSLFALAVSATKAEIGLLNSLANLGGALVLLPGAMIVERFGQRRDIAVWFGSAARLMLLFIALSPLGFTGKALVYLVIGLAVARSVFGNLAFPAWMSLTADMIPLEGRGRYFAARNIVMAIAGMLCVYLAGEWITRTSHPTGYQVVIGIAFALGMISTFSFSRLHEPPPGPISYPKTPLAPLKIWQDVRGYPAFLALVGTAALWNFSLNLAGPFFNIYMVEALQSSPVFVGIASIVSSLAGMFAQKKSGELADRWGPRRVQLISGLLIPIMPIFWVFIRQPWQTLPVNIAAGVLWAAYSLSSFNLLLVLTPAEQRARYSAIYQVIVTLSLAAGAAVGGLMVTHWGYPAIFISSGAGRLAAALLFALFVPAALKK